MTLGQWLDEWHSRQVGRRRWQAGTERRHRSNIDRHLVPNMGGYQLADMRPDDVETLDAKLAAEGLAPKTRASVHGTLRQALADAVRHGKTTVNVATMAGGPTVPRPEVTVPTDQQVAIMLSLAEGAEYEVPRWVFPFLRLAAFTGARPGELAALRWADVDLDRGELLIRGTATADEAGKGYTVREGTKTGVGRRIALDKATVAALKRWLVDGWESALVFPGSTYGTAPMPAHLPRRWFKRLAGRAGIDPACTLYSLRHWHASWLISRGVPPTLVAERLGHANPTQTLNTYGRHVPADRRIADLLDGSHRCDGNHAEPQCSDPQCWRSEAP